MTQDPSATSGHLVELSTGNGDILVQMFGFLAKMQEKGEKIPIAFPETITYEHHFPRGWFRFEAETGAEIAAANAKKKQQQMKLAGGGAGSSGAGSLPDGGPNLDATGSTEFQLHSGSTQTKPFHPMPNQREQEVENRNKTSASDKTLTKKSSKECDSSTISQVFQGSTGKGLLCAEIVQRNPATGELIVQYFDEEKLGQFLLNTPEQCILSKFVQSKLPTNDVIIGTWTPTVFTCERRVSVHPLKDINIVPQQRGDTSILSNYHETTCCPMLASKIREAMQRIVWFLEKYEKKVVLEFTAHFKQDKRMHVWMLWAETLRIAPPLVRIEDTMSASELWDMYEKNEKHRELTRSVTGGSPSGLLMPVGIHQKRSTSTPLSHEKTVKATRGAWPSFCTKSDHSVELLLAVEDQLNVLVSKTSLIKKRLIQQLELSGKRFDVQEKEEATNSAGNGLKPGEKPRDPADPVVPLSLQPLSMLHVHFDEIAANPKPGKNGRYPPPNSPRPPNSEEEQQPELSKVTFDMIKVLDFFQELVAEEERVLEDTEKLHRDFIPRTEVGARTLTKKRSARNQFLKALEPGELENGDNSGQGADGGGRLHPQRSKHHLHRGSGSRQKLASGIPVASHADEAVPVTVHRLKQRIIAKRVEGPSRHHLHAQQEFKLRTLDGLLKDPIFVANDERNQGTAEARSYQHQPRVRKLGSGGGGGASSSGGGPGGSPTTSSQLPSVNTTISIHTRTTVTPPAENSSLHGEHHHGGSGDSGASHKIKLDAQEMEKLRGLDVMHRIEYNQIKKVHSEVLEEMDTIEYELMSKARRSRERVPLVFDLPRGAPVLDDNALLHLKVYHTKDVPSAPHCAEEYTIFSDSNIHWVAQELRLLVAQGARERENAFLDRCQKIVKARADSPALTPERGFES
jgi:hypothetical protein